VDCTARLRRLLDMSYSIARIVLVATTLFGVDEARAMRPSYSKACMIAQSDYIVVATIADISDEPVLRDPFGAIHAVRLEVIESIRGHPIDQSEGLPDLVIAARYGVPEEALLEDGKTYVLFLKNSDAGLHVLNGGQGAVDLGLKASPTRLEASRIPKLRSIKELAKAPGICRTEDM
jgi:hypothetical protein